MSRTAIKSSLPLLIVGLLSATTLFANPPSEEMLDLWNQRANELQTAKIKTLFMFFAVNPGEGDIPQAALNQFLKDLERLVSQGASSRDLQARIDALPMAKRSRVWSELEILIDGVKAKNVRRIPTPDGSVRTHVSAFDGQTQAEHFSDSQQASIHRGVGSYIYRLHDVRPTIHELPELNAVGQHEGYVQFTDLVGGSHLVDRETGLVRSMSFGCTDEATNCNRVDCFDLQEFSGHIIFPRITVAAKGTRRGYLDTLKVFLVTEAEFNVPLDDSEFKVALPPRSLVVDFRNPDAPPVRTKPAVRVPDAIAAADNPRAYSLEGEPESQALKWLYRTGAGILIALGLFVIGWLVLKRTY
jgi:hypothetical protein